MKLYSDKDYDELKNKRRQRALVTTGAGLGLASLATRSPAALRSLANNKRVAAQLKKAPVVDSGVKAATAHADKSKTASNVLAAAGLGTGAASSLTWGASLNQRVKEQERALKRKQSRLINAAATEYSKSDAVPWGDRADKLAHAPESRSGKEKSWRKFVSEDAQRAYDQPLRRSRKSAERTRASSAGLPVSGAAIGAVPGMVRRPMDLRVAALGAVTGGALGAAGTVLSRRSANKQDRRSRAIRARGYQRMLDSSEKVLSNRDGSHVVVGKSAGLDIAGVSGVYSPEPVGGWQGVEKNTGVAKPRKPGGFVRSTTVRKPSGGSTTRRAFVQPTRRKLQ